MIASTPQGRYISLLNRNKALDVSTFLSSASNVLLVRKMTSPLRTTFSNRLGLPTQKMADINMFVSITTRNSGPQTVLLYNFSNIFLCQMMKPFLPGQVHRPFIKLYPGFPLLPLLDKLYEIEDLIESLGRKGLYLLKYLLLFITHWPSSPSLA